MSDEYTPTTGEVRRVFSSCCYSYENTAGRAMQFDAWLTAHEAATRTAALEEAGRDLLRGIGIQSTNGIGWAPTDSLRGAGRYLLHISHAAKDGAQ